MCDPNGSYRGLTPAEIETGQLGAVYERPAKPAINQIKPKEPNRTQQEPRPTPTTGGGIQRINNRKVGGSRARPKVGGSSIGMPDRKLGGL